MQKVFTKWEEMIAISFLSTEWKEMYLALIKERLDKLQMI